MQSEDRVFRTAVGEVHYTAEYSQCEQCGEEFLTRQQARAASRAAVKQALNAPLLPPGAVYFVALAVGFALGVLV